MLLRCSCLYCYRITCKSTNRICCGLSTISPLLVHLTQSILFSRYEREFFLNVVNGHGVISWGAVDTSRSDEGRDELIGFVTTRMIAAKDSEVQTIRRISWKICGLTSELSGANCLNLQIEDLFRYNNSHKDLTLLYILTLGVVDSYRNLGIGCFPVSSS